MANKSGFAMNHRFVLTDETEFEVASNIVDVVRFERATNEAYLDAGTNIKMSTLMWIGWAAACRAKKVPKEGRAKFEMFLPLVEDYEPIFPEAESDDDEDEDEAGDSDPTQPDQQPASLSALPS